MCSLAFKAGMFVFALGGAAFGTWVVYSVVVPKNIKEQLEWDGFRVLSMDSSVDVDDDKYSKLIDSDSGFEKLKGFLGKENVGLNDVSLREIKTKCSQIMKVEKSSESWVSDLENAKLFCSVKEQ